MLKLKSLEISGFKSFVDRVEPEFADGITAIVGPNGCGKSNLSEAITWVLGEQSAKSLRGGKMEDVIFSGTDRRKPLGMAEVSLTLETDEDIQGAEDGRLIIGRRIFRSGESQYRLNDRIVRLKEIKDILADTGLGVRAYSVIEQGRIGQILSSKPVERRKLIEEAAGVTRYKARKRLAELKLEDATANRMRLDDILSEVERALRSLKRQSNAARRFKEREGEYRALMRTVLTARYDALHEQLEELQKSLRDGVDREAGLGAELSAAEAELAQAREHLDELSRDLSKRHQRTAELGARIEGRQEFIRGTRSNVEQMGERVENGLRVAEQRQRQEQEHIEALADLERRKQSLLDARAEATKLLDEGSSRLEQAEKALADAQARESAVRQDLLESSAQVSAVQQRLQRNQIDLEKAQFRLERSDKSAGEKTEQVTKAGEKLAEARQRTDELETECGRLSEELEGVRRELDETVAAESACSERCEELKVEQARLEQRRTLLDELARADEERRADLREALADMGLEAGEPGAGGVRFLDAILDGTELPRGHEAAIDSFLASSLDAAVVPADEDVLSLARELAARNVDATLLRPLQADEAPADPYASLRGGSPAAASRDAVPRPAGRPATRTEMRTEMRTETRIERVPVEREVERTIEEEVDVPHEVTVEVPVEVAAEAADDSATGAGSDAPTPSAPTPGDAPPPRRTWLDVLLSPFRRRPAAASTKAPTSAPTAEGSAPTPQAAPRPGTRTEMRTETRTELRTETRQRTVTETVTEWEEREVTVEVPIQVPVEVPGEHSIDDAAAPAAGHDARPAGALPDGVVALLGEALAVEPGIARALPPAVLVESAEVAERLAPAHPHLGFLAPEGLWIQGGVVRTRAASAAPGALGRQAELQELGERLPVVEQDLAAARGELDDLVRQRSEKAAASSKVGKTLDQRRQELAVATARRQDQQHQVEKLESEQRGIGEEREEIVALIGTLEEARKELDGELETVRRGHAEVETRLETAQSEVASAREGRQEARTEGEGRRSNLRLLEERVESHAQETTRLHRLCEEVREFLQGWNEERTQLTERKASLEAEIEEARVDLQRALEDRDEAEEAKRSVQQALDAQRTRVKELEAAVTTRRDDRDAARSSIQELRVTDAQRRQQAEHVLETFEKEFGEKLEVKEGEEREPVPDNLPELMAELDNLKGIIERMGPVNVLAAEEYEEQEERHVFLTEQRADVQKSIESLRRTIREINETSIERFLEAFNVVNVFFGESFTKLFRGGEASMRLLDEDDPLESGIEIVARPPGKRLQNIQLMSGGEKALTAIALLFALFRHKPSPFCILDEVDAPLDDANVIRFIDTLQEMAKDTQFLVVTHNKLTMEAASTLYGVTMAEKGVSRLVGVDIDDLHPAKRLAS